jgi:hypothetical protein
MARVLVWGLIMMAAWGLAEGGADVAVGDSSWEAAVSEYREFLVLFYANWW